MSRFAFPALALCTLLSGCALGSVPTFSSLGISAEDGPASADAASEESHAVKTADGSVLGSIWDNFSDAFRSGDPPPSHPAPAPAVKNVNAPKLDSAAALQLVNKFRAAKGLKPLTLDPRAARAARLLAEDMAKHDHMSHYGPDGADVGARLTRAGYSYHLAAENIGVGQTTLNEMIVDWEKSPPHRRNLLLADAKHMGIALDYNPNSKYKTFWALVVASP